MDTQTATDTRQEETPSLRASVRDGVSNAVMMGCGEAYLGPFGIFLRATTLQIGILAALPQLFGALMQWVAAVKMDRLPSRRKFILAGASIQAMTLIPLALLPFLFGTGNIPVLGLLALTAVYQGANGSTVPIWNSLIGDLVPAPIRGRFFGHRNRLTGLGSFISLILAGIVLDLFDRTDRAAVGFLIIFCVAFFARLNSVRWLSRYEDPQFSITPDQTFTFRQFLRRSPYSNFAQFVFFIGAINFGVSFSAPYFTLYMLRDLRFSYLEFTLVTGVATVTQFLTFRYWGELSDRFGNKKILTLCGWGIAATPILWLVSHQILYLVIIQIFGGLVWSGFGLASANFIFDAVTPPKRARCVAYQGLVNGFFLLVGSVAGGYAAGHLPQSYSLGFWVWKPGFILPVIFLISGIIRLIAIGLFLSRFQEVRPVETIRHRDLIFRISHIRPIAGVTFSIFTGLLHSLAPNDPRPARPPAAGKAAEPREKRA